MGLDFSGFGGGFVCFGVLVFWGFILLVFFLRIISVLDLEKINAISSLDQSAVNRLVSNRGLNIVNRG